MEFDFSKEIKEFFINSSALKDSEIDTTDISEKIINLLQEKTDQFNACHKNQVSLAKIKKVYQKGADVFGSIYMPGKTRFQWAIARVNLFLKVQKDLPSEFHNKSEANESFYLDTDNNLYFQDIEFDLAKLDLIKAGLTTEQIDFDPEIKLIDIDQDDLKIYIEEENL